MEVTYESMGNTATIEVLGKSMAEWVSLTLGDGFFNFVPYDENKPLPQLLKPYIRKGSEYTVALFSDTPLVTRRSVFDAIETLKRNNLNVLKLTRGYIFKTDYLLEADNIYSERTYYFDEEDFITAFSFKQLAMIRDLLKNRILNFHMEHGTNIADMGSTFIGPDVTIGKGVTIAPGNHIIGKTIIKDGVKIKPNNIIEDSILDEYSEIESSRLKKCYIGRYTITGPYSYIRPDSVIGNYCRIGDFVEIKNSIIGDSCKVAHLAYVGDCEMGENCNIGCGVVFANYDGEKKHKSMVGRDVFIGSNANLVAPIVIGDGAFIAAGSTINKNVPPGALGIARARQENKAEWGKNKYSNKHTEEQSNG